MDEYSPPPPIQFSHDCPMTNLQVDHSDNMILDSLQQPLPDIIADNSNCVFYSPQPPQQSQSQPYLHHHQIQQPLPPQTINSLDSAMTIMTINNPQRQQEQQQRHQHQEQDQPISLDYVMGEFLTMLKDTDPEIVMRTANLLHEWSKSEYGQRAISESRDMIKMLTSLRPGACLEGTIYYVSGVLNSVSLHPNGRYHIVEEVNEEGVNGMKCLIDMLESKMEPIVIHALTTIHNLLAYHEGASDLFKKNGGIPHIVALLDNDNNHKFLAVVTDCVYRLAFDDSISQKIVLENNGAGLLLKALKNYNEHKRKLYAPNDGDYLEIDYLIERCLLTLKLLAKNISGKEAIIRGNGIGIIGESLIQNKIARSNILKASLLTLRHLSDHDDAIQYPELEPLLQELLHLLKLKDSTVTTYSLTMLRNLSCNNQKNKRFLVEVNAIRSIMESMDEDIINKPEIIESVFYTLRNLTGTDSVAMRKARMQIAIHGLDIIKSIVINNANEQHSVLSPACELLKRLLEEQFDESTIRRIGEIYNICCELQLMINQ